CPQIRQVRRGQPKTAKHFFSVLADGGRILMDASGRFGKVNPRSKQGGGPRGRMIAFNERAPLFDMLIFHYLANGQDRRAEVIQLAQPIPDFLTSFASRPASYYFFQVGAVL